MSAVVPLTVVIGAGPGAAGQVGEVEDGGREGGDGGSGGAGGDCGGGDGGEVVRREGGGEVEVCFEEFGVAAVVEVHGGEDYVDGVCFPVGGFRWLFRFSGFRTTYSNKPGGGGWMGGLGSVDKQAVFGAAVGQ